MFKVILGDNQAVFRAGIAKILAMEDDFRIVAQCPDSERLYQTLDAFRNAVILFSSTLNVEVSLLKGRVTSSGCRAIIILENHESPKPWLEQEIQGILYRSVTGSTLIDCVRKVAMGGQYLQPALDVLRRAQDEDEVGARVRDRLTPKELRIVSLIVQGCKNKEIAIRLGTTEQVVKNYLRSIYDKTGVSDRLELALFTIHHRMLAEAAEAMANEILLQAC
jgi:DNA-binding NarL/FixJ family response regulator